MIIRVPGIPTTLSQIEVGGISSKVGSPYLTPELDDFTKETGSHIIYLRRYTDMKHKCWDPIRSQPAGIKVDPICYGTGYVISLERRRVRDYGQATPGRETQSSDDASPGRIDSSFRVFIMLPDANPKVIDMIFRVSWVRPEYNRVESLIEAHEIQRVSDFRDEQGILVYYKVYCIRASINHNTIDYLIRNDQRVQIVN